MHYTRALVPQLVKSTECFTKNHTCVSFKVYLKALALNAAVGSATRSCSQPLNGVCHRVFVMRSSKGLWGNGVDRTPLANGDAVLKANLSFPFFFQNARILITCM